MKAKIMQASYSRSWQSPYGEKHDHKIVYQEANGVEKTASYTSNSKEQDKFKAGQEMEVEVTEQAAKNGNVYYKIKPVQAKGSYTLRGKSIQREQARYAAFSMSYAKDLLVAGIIKTSEDMFKTSKQMFNHMVELDKTLIDDNG